ncbi:hypothetical protein H5410_029241 [Solanum commersonii]|uniref:Uncharacterized protein n=1 Tax=Solanum commersonii TaxID=4109 RepID=A0A9J5Z695_SOLCO|nr:hypothetical protein H5410_029241 [Solanum commersonii]
MKGLPALGSFDHENGRFCPWEPTGSITKVLADIYENFWQKSRQNFDHQKSKEYSIRKSTKWGTSMEYFGKNHVEILDHQKSMDYSTRKLAKYGVYLL